MQQIPIYNLDDEQWVIDEAAGSATPMINRVADLLGYPCLFWSPYWLDDLEQLDGYTVPKPAELRFEEEPLAAGRMEASVSRDVLKGGRISYIVLRTILPRIQLRWTMASKIDVGMDTPYQPRATVPVNRRNHRNVPLQLLVAPVYDKESLGGRELLGYLKTRAAVHMHQWVMHNNTNSNHVQLEVPPGAEAVDDLPPKCLSPCWSLLSIYYLPADDLSGREAVAILESDSPLPVNWVSPGSGPLDDLESEVQVPGNFVVDHFTSVVLSLVQHRRVQSVVIPRLESHC
ncbi:hypothetical protein ABEF95_007942 [Exophiala dermatitidis]